MIHIAYKFRLYPKENQKDLLEKHFGHTRSIYNLLLAMRKEKGADGKYISANTAKKKIAILKKTAEFKWLSEVNSQSLQEAAINLDSAYKRFFKKEGGYPKFKTKKKGKFSFSVPQNFIVDTDKQTIMIPKFKKPLQCVFHRKLTGLPKSLTISRTSTGKYFVSIVCEVPVESKNASSVDKIGKIGIDLGLTTFATLSNGEKIDPLKAYHRHLGKLKKLSRKHSKKQKGSKNRNKSRIKLARLHEKIANTRRDFQHKLSSRLIKENQFIAHEDLCVKGMIRNPKLARRIADASWYEFIRQLTYKGKWYGAKVVKIGRFEPTTKICSHCGNYLKDGLDLSVREWTCSECNTHHDRDVNAALMILKIGKDIPDVKPVEKQTSRRAPKRCSPKSISVKQEPVLNSERKDAR